MVHLLVRRRDAFFFIGSKIFFHQSFFGLKNRDKRFSLGDFYALYFFGILVRFGLAKGFKEF